MHMRSPLECFVCDGAGVGEIMLNACVQSRLARMCINCATDAVGRAPRVCDIHVSPSATEREMLFCVLSAHSFINTRCAAYESHLYKIKCGMRKKPYDLYKLTALTNEVFF